MIEDLQPVHEIKPQSSQQVSGQVQLVFLGMFIVVMIEHVSQSHIERYQWSHLGRLTQVPQNYIT